MAQETKKDFNSSLRDSVRKMAADGISDDRIKAFVDRQKADNLKKKELSASSLEVDSLDGETAGFGVRLSDRNVDSGVPSVSGDEGQALEDAPLNTAAIANLKDPLAEPQKVEGLSPEALHQQKVDSEAVKRVEAEAKIVKEIEEESAKQLARNKTDLEVSKNKDLSEIQEGYLQQYRSAFSALPIEEQTEENMARYNADMQKAISDDPRYQQTVNGIGIKNNDELNKELNKINKAYYGIDKVEAAEKNINSLYKELETVPKEQKAAVQTRIEEAERSNAQAKVDMTDKIAGERYNYTIDGEVVKRSELFTYLKSSNYRDKLDSGDATGVETSDPNAQGFIDTQKKYADNDYFLKGFNKTSVDIARWVGNAPAFVGEIYFKSLENAYEAVGLEDAAEASKKNAEWMKDSQASKWDAFENIAEVYEDKYQKDYDIFDLISEGKYVDAAQATVRGTVDNLPFTVAMAAAAPLGAPAAFGLMALSTGAGERKAYIEENEIIRKEVTALREEGKNDEADRLEKTIVSDEAALAGAFSKGLLEAGTEQIQLKILGNQLGDVSKVASRLSTLYRGGKGLKESVIREYKDEIKKSGINLINNTFQESGSEFVAGYSQAWVDAISRGEQFDQMKGIRDGGLGAITTLPMTLAPGAVSMVGASRVYNSAKKQQEADMNRELLKQVTVDMEGATPEQKKVLLKQTEDIVKEEKAANKEAAKTHAKASPEQKEELVETQEKINNLEDSKEVLHDDTIANDKIKALQSNKDEIIKEVLTEDKTKEDAKDSKEDKKAKPVQKQTDEVTKQAEEAKVEEEGDVLKAKRKVQADAVRDLKFYKTPSQAMAKLQSDPTGLFKGAWDGSMEIIATSIEVSGSLELAVRKGVAHIKQSEWYKQLSSDGKKEAVRLFEKESSEAFKAFSEAKVVPKKEPVKTTIRKTTGQVDVSPEVKTTEKKLLKEKYKNIQRGFKTGVKETKEDLATLKGDIRKYAQGMIPSVAEATWAKVKPLMTAIEKAKNLKDVAKAWEQIDGIIEKIEGSRKKNLLKKISESFKKGKAQKVSRLGKKQAKSTEAETQAFSVEAHKVIDAVRKGDTETIEDMRDEVHENIQEAITAMGSGEKLSKKHQEIIDKSLALEALADAADMTADELEGLLENIQAGLKASREELKKKVMQRAEAKAKLNKDIDEQLDKEYTPSLLKSKGENVKDKRAAEELKSIGLTDKIMDWIKDYASRPTIISTFRGMWNLETFTEAIDKSTTFFTKLIHDRLYDQATVESESRRDTNRDIDKIVQSNSDYKEMRDIANDMYKDESTIKVGGVQLKKAEAMRIYAESLNEDSMASLENTSVSEKDIDRIKEFIGEDIVGVVDGIVDYLTNDYYESVDEVYSRVNLTHLKRIDNYFPSKKEFTTQDEMEIERRKGTGHLASVTPGSFISRVKGDRKTMLVDDYTDFFNVLANHVSDLEHYKAYAEVAVEMDAVLNNEKFGNLLKNLGIDVFVKRGVENQLNPSKYKDQTPSTLNKILNNYVIGKLALKPIQILKQSTSVVGAFTDYSWGKEKSVADLPMFVVDLLMNLPELLSGKMLKDAREASALLDERMDTGLNVIFGGTNVYTEEKSKIEKVSGYPTKLGDVLGVLGYYVAYKRDIKNGMSKDKALKKLNRYGKTNQSQIAADMIDYQRASNPLMKVFTRFLSSPFLLFNNTIQSSNKLFRLFVNGKLFTKAARRETRKLIVNGMVLNSVFQVASNAVLLAYGDEDEREFALTEIAKAASGITFIQSIPLLGAELGYMVDKSLIPLTKRQLNEAFGLDLSEKRHGWRRSSTLNPYSAAATNFTKVADAMMKEEEFEDKDWDNVYKLADELINIGFGTSTKSSKALYNVFKDAKEGEQIQSKDVGGALGITPSYLPKRNLFEKETTRPARGKKQTKYITK